MAAAGVTHCPAGCRSPRLRHPRVLPRKPRVLGKGSHARFPAIAASCARPDSSGHRVPRGTGPDMPKPSSAQRQGTAGSGTAGSGGSQGSRAPGGEPRTAARRALASGSRAAPGPAGPSPAGPPAELPPASRVPHSPYLAPGRGASGGGDRGRRPARLPRFRRSQELNIPPLRAAPMRKTSRQQHHLPLSAEPPAGQPPGTPGPVPRGEAGARGRGEPRCCTPPFPPWDWMHSAGKGTAGKVMSGLRVPQWDHQQVLWRF